MFAFFYSVYYALFSGVWHTYTPENVNSFFQNAFYNIADWLMNALGGHFTEFQNMEWDTYPLQITCLILSLVTLVSICAGVFALVKGVFRIFFNRG